METRREKERIDVYSLRADEVPSFFRESFILTGYRLPQQPWSYYWKSLFRLHNETGNVWSHLIAAAVVLKSMVGFYKTYNIEDDKYAWSTLGFSFGCLLGCICSSVAHNFHSKSIWLHYVFFMLDYGGVTIYTFGTGLGCIYICSQRQVYSLMESCFLPLNVFFSWFTFYCFCRAKLSCSTTGSRRFRMIAVTLLYAFIISIPVFARYFECFLTKGCSILSLNHLTFCFLLLALNAVLFASHMPERFAPGKFDFLGHSHFLFHCNCIWTLSMQMEGVREDIRRGAAAHADPKLENIIGAYVILILMQSLTVYALRGEIAKRVKKDMDSWRSISMKDS